MIILRKVVGFVRRLLLGFMLASVVFFASPAKCDDQIWKPESDLDYGSLNLFQWLEAKREDGYVIGSKSQVPQFEGDTPDGICFRGNGVCELDYLLPTEDVDVIITRGTWKVVGDRLEMVLTSQETYGEGHVSEIDPPAIESFEIADWQDTRFRIIEPTPPRMFEGIATEIKREYLIGVWMDVPFVAEGGDPITLDLEEDGTYEMWNDGMNVLAANGECISKSWGTWAVKDNKLEITKTGQRKNVGGKIKTMADGELRMQYKDSIIQEFDPPIVNTYEITDLQYVFEIPKELNWNQDVAIQISAFIKCDGLMFLGYQLTMRIEEIQFWC